MQPYFEGIPQRKEILFEAIWFFIRWFPMWSYSHPDPRANEISLGEAENVHFKWFEFLIDGPTIEFCSPRS